MTIAITTAGIYDKEGIGWEMHDYATKVLDGTFVDDSFFAFIATPDEEDAEDGGYFTELAQQKANPNWGVSVKPDYLAKQAEKAQRQPGFLNEYLVKHLNVWTQQAKRWLPMDRWARCETPLPPGADARALAVAREKQLEGRECRGGLDLSSKLDLTALVLEFTDESGKFVDLVCRFWLPEERVKETVKKGMRYYETWVREGWLQTTPGDVVDYEFIRAEVNELAKRYVLKELAFDPWGATDLATRLMGDGQQMVECRQGFKTLSEPSKLIEADVTSGRLRHMHNPLLRWCAANAVVLSDPAGNIKPDKSKASERIDGIVALIMARSRAIIVKDDDEGAYEERGFLSL
jgi:phage terminase large subunit-like protein